MRVLAAVGRLLSKVEGVESIDADVEHKKLVLLHARAQPHERLQPATRNCYSVLWWRGN